MDVVAHTHCIPGHLCSLFGPEFLSSHSHTSVKKRRTRPRNVEGKLRKLNYEMKGNNSSTLIYCVALKPNQVSLKVFTFCHHCCSIIIIGVYIFRSRLFVFLFNRAVVFSLLKVFFHPICVRFFELIIARSGSTFLCVFLHSFQTIIIVGCCNSAAFLADGWLVC